MSPRGATFELERFSLSPITADVALLEVEGRLAGAPKRFQAPRMLIEPAYGARREHAPVEATTREGRVRASFAVPAEEIDTSALALAVGGLLLDLPAPDPVAAADRTVALAREANGLRHELIALEEEVAASRDAADARAAELERQELAVADREAQAERRAAEREAEAERAASERIAEAERAASERQAELTRAAAKRQGELERETTELGRVLADVRTVTEERDAAAAAESARLADERDAARADADAAAARIAELTRAQEAAQAELETLRRALDEHEEEPRDGEDPTTEQRPAEPDATAARPAAVAPRAGEDPTTTERPVEAEAAIAVASPDDTGPTPLRRGPIRRSPVAPAAPGASARDRPWGAALQSPTDAGLESGPSTRALALAALAVAALLVVVAILGFVL